MAAVSESAAVVPGHGKVCKRAFSFRYEGVGPERTALIRLAAFVDGRSFLGAQADRMS